MSLERPPGEKSRAMRTASSMIDRLATIVLAGAAVVVVAVLITRWNPPDTPLVRDDRTCLDCKVQFDLVLTIGSYDGSDWIPEQPRSVAQDGRGRLYLAIPNLGHLLVFDSKGRSLANIGRSGEGPGEFQLPYLVRATQSDTVLAFDWTRQLSAFAPSGNFVRRTRVPIRASAFVVTGDGSVVFGGQREGTDPGHDGMAFHVFNGRESALEGSFHQSQEVDAAQARFYLAPSAHYPDRFWAASSERFDLMQYATDGTLMRRYTDSRLWMRPLPQEDGIYPPTPVIRALVEVEDQLWILGRHPSKDWKRYWNREVFGEDGEVSINELDISKLYRSVVEVLDIETGRLITSGSLPGYALALLPDRRVVTFRQNDAGVPLIDVFQVSVVGTTRSTK